MAGLGVALKGFGMLARGVGKVLKKKPKQTSLKLKTDTKTTLKSALLNKPKGPAGKKYKSRIDYMKDTNKKAKKAFPAVAAVGIGVPFINSNKKKKPVTGRNMYGPKGGNKYP